MNAQGYYLATFYNPLTGVGAQLNLVGEESEMMLKEPFENDKTGRGEFIYSGDNSFINLIAYDMDSSVFNVLKGFMDAGTRCQVALIGVNEVVLWEEPAKIKVKKQKGFTTGRRNRMEVRIAKEGGVHNIFDGINILRQKYGWASLPLTGYSFTGTLAGGFAGDENLITLETGQFLRSDIILPVEGITATLSYDRGSTHTGTTYVMSLQALNFAGSVIATESLNVPTSTPTGILSVALKQLPANVYTLRCNLAVMSTGTANEVPISSPRLRFDGKVEDIRS